MKVHLNEMKLCIYKMLEGKKITFCYFYVFWVYFVVLKNKNFKLKIIELLLTIILLFKIIFVIF
jgi:hypothetical protein